jgi:hypothetical protein
MARLAVIGMSTRKGLTKRVKLRLWLSEARVARFTLDVVVRRFQGKPGVIVQTLIEHCVGADKGFMNRGMTMLARVIEKEIQLVRDRGKEQFFVR